jgi:hypothetical protein
METYITREFNDCKSLVERLAFTKLVKDVSDNLYKLTAIESKIINDKKIYIDILNKKRGIDSKKIYSESDINDLINILFNFTKLDKISDINISSDESIQELIEFTESYEVNDFYNNELYSKGHSEMDKVVTFNKKFKYISHTYYGEYNENNYLRISRINTVFVEHRYDVTQVHFDNIYKELKELDFKYVTAMDFFYYLLLSSDFLLNISNLDSSLNII